MIEMFEFFYVCKKGVSVVFRRVFVLGLECRGVG